MNKIENKISKIEKFLDISSYIVAPENYGGSLRSKFIYQVLGHRKYQDTCFLEYFSDDMLARMIYGFMLYENDITEGIHTYMWDEDYDTIKDIMNDNVNLKINYSWSRKLGLKISKDNKVNVDKDVLLQTIHAEEDIAKAEGNYELTFQEYLKMERGGLENEKKYDGDVNQGIDFIQDCIS